MKIIHTPSASAGQAGIDFVAPTNSAINVEILKDAESTRSALSLGSVRCHQQIATKFFNSQALGMHPQFRIAVMGDSWRRQVAESFWYGRFGIGGRICVPDDETEGFVTRANGTTTGASSASWCGSNWWEVPTNGTVTKNSWWTGSAFVPVSRATVVYFTESGGGTFKLQHSLDGSSWTDISGASYNCSGGTRTLVYQTVVIDGNFCRDYRVRAIGLSGTCRIVALGAHLPGSAVAAGNRPQGCIVWDMGEGGTVPGDWVAMPQAGFTTAIQGFDPDVVFIRGWDVLADWQAHLPTLVSRLRTAKPLVDIIVVGRHPTNVDGPSQTGLLDTPQDAWVREYCRNNNMTFVDVKPFLPIWSEGVSRLWYNNSDGVHLTELGEAAVDAIVRDHIPILRGAVPHRWKIIGTTPTRNWLHGTQGVMANGQWRVVGESGTALLSVGMINPDGNTEANFQNLPGTGIVRLKLISGWQHDGRLGFVNGNTLTGIIGAGRMWIGNAGTISGNVEGGINKNINAAIATQAPATTVPAAMFGGIASQTAHILTINTGASTTSDGTVVGGFTATGRLFAVVPSYADDAAADADSALPAGGLYRTTAGGRAVFAKP
jgi:hypothetical protein